jgi:hypothetical protein
VEFVVECGGAMAALAGGGGGKKNMLRSSRDLATSLEQIAQATSTTWHGFGGWLKSWWRCRGARRKSRHGGLAFG